MLLEGKNAVIYGAGGSIGGAIARAFAREGAAVYLAGRTLESLEKVADQVRSAGGAADTAQLDALDEHQVDAHAEAVAAKAGGIDKLPLNSADTAAQTTTAPRSAFASADTRQCRRRQLMPR